MEMRLREERVFVPEGRKKKKKQKLVQENSEIKREDNATGKEKWRVIRTLKERL